MHPHRIHVLERGHLIESGRHDQLLAEKGLYYAMWRQQVGERRAGEDKTPSPDLLAAAARG